MRLLKTEWTLSLYSKETELVEKEYELQEFDAAKWQILLGNGVDLSMYGAHRVLPEHLEFIQQYINDPVDLSKFDCFVEEYGVYEWDKQK